MASVVPLAIPAIRRVRSVQRSTRTRYLRALHPRGSYITCEGVPVHCNFGDASYVWYDGRSPNLELDLQLLDLLLPQVDGDVFFDVGAHWGFFTGGLAQRVGSGARIVAVEADPRHVPHLARTVDRFEGIDIVVVPVALGANEGTLTLYGGDADCSHVFPVNEQVPIGIVRATRLDTLVDLHCPPDRRVALVKVDIDGAEPGFLRGAEKTIEHHRPVMFMEFAPTYLSAYGEDPAAFLRSLTERFVVHWVTYLSRTVERIGRDDVDDVVRRTGTGVSDLVLSPAEISLAGARRHA